MEEAHKEILMTSVICDDFIDVKNILSQCSLTRDDSFFDYDLLKAALERKHLLIVTLLLDVGCRVRKSNENNAEETPLHLAIKLGNINIIRRMLKNGAIIEDKNGRGDTPLYTAFKLKRYEIVDELLNYFYGPSGIEQSKCFDPLDEDDNRHFHISCIRNNLYIVNLYLKRGFNVNRKFSLDSSYTPEFSPLYYAITQENYGLFECLLQNGADFSIKYNNKEQTLLHIIYYSDLPTIRLLSQIFNYGNDSVFNNSLDYNGISHFHLCCMINNPYKIQIFIDNGVNVNSSTFFNSPVNPGFTPLHFAVMHDSINVVELLLKNGADCNKVDKEGNTPLHLVSTKNGFINKHLIKILLDYNASPTAKNDEGFTPLHQLFYNTYTESSIIDLIISKIPTDINIANPDGLTYFHIICTRNNTSRVKDFLDSGVDIDTCVHSGKYESFTALHFAILFNQKNVVEILLNRNAQVNLKTGLSNFGEMSSSLHLACNFNMKFREVSENNVKQDNSDWASSCKSQLDIVELLILHGADVNGKNVYGQTPLLNTCTIDRDLNCKDDWLFYSNIVFKREIHAHVKEIIQILLLNKANINVRSYNQETILHIICKNTFLKDSDELLEFFISNGVDINAADEDGLTPLHIAVELKRIELVKILLQYKANVNARSKLGKIPLQLLVKRFTGYSSVDKNILSLLLKNGSNVNIKYKDGMTMWLNAIADYNSFLLEQLLNYGADINMEDSLGNPLILSVLTNCHFLSSTFANLENAMVFYFIFIHVQKLQAAGLYVNDEVDKFCNKLHKNLKSTVLNLSYLEMHTKVYNIKYLDRVYGLCLNELERLKLVKLDHSTSLFTILKKNIHELSKYVKNSTFLEFLNDENTYTTFSLYSHWLEAQFMKGLERCNLLQQAKSSFACMSKLSFPDLCYDSIFQYLSNEDIVNLNSAAKINYKRKLNDDNSEDEIRISSKIMKKSSEM